MPFKEPYSIDPDASDIAIIDADAGSVGAIRINDTDDIDVVELFSENTEEFEVSCESSEVPDVDKWELVGIKRGADFGDDFLTFDPITKAGGLGIEDILDASLGSITEDGQFPFTKDKCAGFAQSAARSEYNKDGNSRWLCESDGNSSYASIFIGYDGSHPWKEAGNVRHGFTLSDGIYGYYDDSFYTNFFIRNIGSKPNSGSAGVPKISAEWVWTEAGVSLFANKQTVISVTEDRVVVNANYVAEDGYHKIKIAGFSNSDARGGSDGPCSEPTQQLTSLSCNENTDSVASQIVTANGSRSSCAAKTLEFLPIDGMPAMAPGVDRPTDSGMMRVGIR